MIKGLFFGGGGGGGGLSRISMQRGKSIYYIIAKSIQKILRNH